MGMIPSGRDDPVAYWKWVIKELEQALQNEWRRPRRDAIEDEIHRARQDLEQTIRDLRREWRYTYTIRKGDTLSRIARDYGVGLETFYEVNRDRVESRDHIKPGENLRVPKMAVRRRDETRHDTDSAQENDDEPNQQADNSILSTVISGNRTQVIMACLYKLFKDRQGAQIFFWWMEGTGKNRIFICDPQWSAYMKKHSELRGAARAYIIQDIAERKDSGQVSTVTSIELSDNGYSTGYELLHGTNWKVGGLRIHGKVDVTTTPDGVTCYAYDLEFAWCDIIDPNNIYTKDWIYSSGLKNAFGNLPRDYKLYILWKVASKVYIKDGQIIKREGYPFENEGE
ncbi:MAG: LysM domain-containing protein [Planctomycetota bacterium]